MNTYRFKLWTTPNFGVAVDLRAQSMADALAQFLKEWREDERQVDMPDLIEAECLGPVVQTGDWDRSEAMETCHA